MSNCIRGGYCGKSIAVNVLVAQSQVALECSAVRRIRAVLAFSRVRADGSVRLFRLDATDRGPTRNSGNMDHTELGIAHCARRKAFQLVSFLLFEGPMVPEMVPVWKTWRYLDGTFMPESEKEAAYLSEYERHAAGGRARARTAQRAPDGAFVSSEGEGVHE